MKFIPIRYISNLSVVGHGVLDRELDPKRVDVIADKQLTADDEFVVVTSDAVITLPSAANEGMYIVIKNKNAISTIVPLAGQTIDGAPFIDLYEYEALGLYADGNSEWLIV